MFNHDEFYLRSATVVAVFAAAWNLTAVGSWAQDQNRPPSAIQALEYSMKGLYESASEVASKNKWLTAEIGKLEQEIRFLEGEIQTLETKDIKEKISTALDDREIMDSIPWDEKRLNAMYEDYIKLDEENTYLKDRLLGKQNDQKGIEAAVERMEKEIAALNGQQQLLVKRLNQPLEPLAVGQLESTLKRSLRSLNYATKKYKKLEKDYGRPLVKFNQIKDRNLELKGRLAYMKSQLNALEAQKLSIAQEIQQIMANSDGNMDEDILKLRQERQALLLVMDKAQQKLGPEFKVPDYSREIEQTNANITTIQQDNDDLKRKLNQLQKKLIRE
jgi:chromosome segregation ATPase